jgi:hypothetical protein
MPARSSSLGLRLLWRPLGFSSNKCVHYMHINYSECIHPKYLFYCFECCHRVCPNLSSAPCTVLYTFSTCLSPHPPQKKCTYTATELPAFSSEFFKKKFLSEIVGEQDTSSGLPLCRSIKFLQNSQETLQQISLNAV